MIHIFGSMGYLGSSLMDWFSNNGYHVRGYPRHCWPDRFRPEDTIINCAASGYRRKVYDIAQTVEDNYLLPKRLYEMSESANFIQIGSWTEECLPMHPYSRSKGLASDYLADKAHVCLMCSAWGGIYESPEKFMMGFLSACAKGAKFTLTHPFRQRDYVHIDTFCEKIGELSASRDYKKRYFATGRMRSFHEVFHTLRDITNREFPNVVFADDVSTNYMWRPIDPIFEDTFRDDLRREWRNVNE